MPQTHNAKLCLQQTVRDLQRKNLYLRPCNPGIKLNLCLSCFLGKGNRVDPNNIADLEVTELGRTYQGSQSRPRPGEEKSSGERIPGSSTQTRNGDKTGKRRQSLDLTQYWIQAIWITRERLLSRGKFQ